MLYRNEEQTREAAERLAKNIGSLNAVEIVSPLEITKTKEDWKRATLSAASFGKSFRVNPFFRYDEAALRRAFSRRVQIDRDWDIIQENCTHSASDVAMTILQQRVNAAILTTEIAACILLGKDCENALNVGNKYETPRNDLVVEAYDLARKKTRSANNTEGSILTDSEIKALESAKIDATELSLIFLAGITQLEPEALKEWDILLADVAAIDVRDRSAEGKPTIFIPRNKEVNGLKALELFGHEILCHFGSSVRTKKFFAKILADSPLLPLAGIMAKNDNELLYEGVAKISDVSIMGAQDEPRPYATIAIDQARRGSNFAEVAELIYDLKLNSGSISPTKALDTAWGITYRTFRGITDTAVNHGGYAFTKDACYFAGYRKAKELENDPHYANYSSLSVEEVRVLKETCPDEFTAEPIDYSSLITLIKNRILYD